MKSLELSTIFTVVPPSTVSWMPSSVGTESFKISSVPSGWTRTATVPGFTLVTGVSTLVSPALLGTSMFTTGAVMEFRVASTSTGAFTASPFFLAVSTALPLSWVSAVVWPCLSVFTVPVEPSATLFSVTELPLGLVVVLEVLPSLAVVVSTLVPSFLVSVWTLVPSGLVVVPTFPVLPELSRSEDELPQKLLKPPEEDSPPPEEEPPEDWA